MDGNGDESVSIELNKWLLGYCKKSSRGSGKQIEHHVDTHPQLLKDIDFDTEFFEQYLTLEQLNDYSPLSRICISDPTKSKGLNKDEAVSQSIANGRNMVTMASRGASLHKILAQCLNTFRMFLLIAAIVCFIIYCLNPWRAQGLVLSITLMTVFIVLCIVSYQQENRASKQVEGFQSIIPSTCIVIRSNERSRVTAAQIVFGDIVCLSPGTRVPADIRLIYAKELKLETSWVTGKVELLDFHSKAVPRDTSALEAQNIALNGCQCVNGEGLGIVIRIGNQSIMGKLIASESKNKGKSSKLELEHQSFVRFINILALVMGLITFLFGLVINRLQNLINTFINGFLVIVVANLPQGLPVTLATSLIIIARRLAKMKFYMKRPDVANTLGATTVLMCDKTGVFTSDKKRVTQLWFDLKSHQAADLAEQHGILNCRQMERAKIDEQFSFLLAVMSVCNKAQFESIASGNLKKWRELSFQICDKADVLNMANALNNEDSFAKHHGLLMLDIRAALQHKNISGDPSETALLNFVEKVSCVKEIRGNYDIIAEIPFIGRRRFQIAFVKAKEESDLDDGLLSYIFVKGAPEELIVQCKRIAVSKSEIEITTDHINQFMEAYDTFAQHAHSCIAFAYAKIISVANFDESIDWINLCEYDLCFLGMAALYEPPKDNTLKCLATLRDAGIKCFMVTGDHPSTATAVAKQIGLMKIPSKSLPDGTGNANDIVIHGDMLENLTPNEWDEILSQDSLVFARTTPEQKLIITKECQRRGEIVAVTGNGICDAPALKLADVGIAIDALGSMMAKEASDIVLMDVELTTIERAIKEGRLLYGNLKKTIAYTMSHIPSELLAVVLNFTVGIPLGLSSLQVLTIDLITELPPSIAMTYEPAERDIMMIKPRKSKSKLVSSSLLVYSYLIAGTIIFIGCISSYFTVFWLHDIAIDQLLFSNGKYWFANATNLITANGHIYTPEMQIEIHQKAAAAWHITLVMSQVFHFWACTTRRTSLFRHGLKNSVAIFAVLIEIVLLLILIYTPFIQNWLYITDPPAYVWLFSIIVGVVLLAYNEIRKVLIRRCPNSRIVAASKW